MTEKGGEVDQALADVDARSIPSEKRADSEGVTLMPRAA